MDQACRPGLPDLVFGIGDDTLDVVLGLAESRVVMVLWVDIPEQLNVLLQELFVGVFLLQVGMWVLVAKHSHPSSYAFVVLEIVKQLLLRGFVDVIDALEDFASSRQVVFRLCSKTGKSLHHGYLMQVFAVFRSRFFTVLVVAVDAVVEPIALLRETVAFMDEEPREIVVIVAVEEAFDKAGVQEVGIVLGEIMVVGLVQHLSDGGAGHGVVGVLKIAAELKVIKGIEGMDGGQQSHFLVVGEVFFDDVFNLDLELWNVFQPF